MTLLREAELLGVNSDELEIKGSGAHTVVRLNTNVLHNLVASRVNNSGSALPDRVYLVLENIRGTYDAGILNVYINVPEDASQGGDVRDLLAGSVGLYGLRRASVQHGEDRGLGLSFVLDITRILFEQPAAKSPYANEIHVSIVPQPQLPNAVEIVVGRVGIFRQRMSQLGSRPNKQN
jgi:tyrosinase